MMKKILIVETSEIMSAELAKILCNEWEPHICRNAGDFSEMIKSVEPDALIIDLNFQSKNGLELLADQFPDLPPAIIAISTFVNSQIEHSAARWGVDYLFEIPFDISKIKRALDDAMQKLPAKHLAQHLRVLNYRPGLDGYACLIVAAMVKWKDPDKKFGKEVYVETAEICGMTDYRDVEHAIRVATNDAWERRNIETWAKYFPLNKDGDVDKPKNRDVIRCLVNLIK